MPERDETLEALEALLAQDAESVEADVAGALRDEGANLDRLVFYGAGNVGLDVLARARAVGIEPLAFADDTAEKHGRVSDGLPVLAPQAAVERYGDVTFVVTMLNSRLPFLRARARLLSIGAASALSFAQLGRLFPSAFLPYHYLSSAETILSASELIRKAFRVFSDDESRRELVSHLRFRLSLDYTTLPAKSIDTYFPQFVLERLTDSTTFVDCGAYDGDTVRVFLDRRRDRFGRILALEPDEANFRELDSYIRNLPESIGRRVEALRLAVGARRGTAPFRQTGDMSAALDGAGASTVGVAPLDALVGENGGPAYVKLDIEGGELDALDGARMLIERRSPMLAVSAYHLPHDLWKIPMHLHSANPQYELRLRTEGDDGTGIVCYALPPDRRDS